MRFPFLSWILSGALIIGSTTPMLAVKQLCYHKNPCTGGCGRENVCHLDAAEAHPHAPWKCEKCIRRDQIRSTIATKRGELQKLQNRLATLTIAAQENKGLQRSLSEARSKLAEAESLLSDILNSDDTSLRPEAERKVAKWNARVSEISAKLEDIEEKNAKIEAVKKDIRDLDGDIRDLEAEL